MKSSFLKLSKKKRKPKRKTFGLKIWTLQQQQKKIDGDNHTLNKHKKQSNTNPKRKEKKRIIDFREFEENYKFFCFCLYLSLFIRDTQTETNATKGKRIYKITKDEIFSICCLSL